MAVYPRENGIYFVQFMYKGKTYIKSSHGRNKAKAMQLEAKMRAELIDQELLGNPKEISLEEAVTMWVDKNKNQSRYVTFCSIEKWFKPHIKNMKLHEVDTAWLHRIIDKKRDEGVAEGTLKAYIQFINGVTKNANKYGYRVIPYSNPKIAKTAHKMRFLTVDEETRLLNALDLNHPECRIHNYPRFWTQHNGKVQDDYDLCILLLDTGARLNEIQRLEWKQINLEERTIDLYRPKVRNRSVLFMTKRVHEVLTRRFENKTGAYVFTDLSGSYRKSIQGLRKTMDAVGLKDVRIHDLRHTSASRLVQNGLSIQETQLILGHKDIQTTLRYAHLSELDTSRKAKDILDKFNR